VTRLSIFIYNLDSLFTSHLLYYLEQSGETVAIQKLRQVDPLTRLLSLKFWSASLEKALIVTIH